MAAHDVTNGAPAQEVARTVQELIPLPSCAGQGEANDDAKGSGKNKGRKPKRQDDDKVRRGIEKAAELRERTLQKRADTASSKSLNAAASAASVLEVAAATAVGANGAYVNDVAVPMMATRLVARAIASTGDKQNELVEPSAKAAMAEVEIQILSDDEPPFQGPGLQTTTRRSHR